MRLTGEPDRGRTIREVIVVALEGLQGRPREWLADDQRTAALRRT